MHQEPSRYRYCTTFVVEGEQLDAASLEAELEALGDSLLVVGDPEALKIHVHTDDPGAALSLGTRAGTIEAVEIADMHRQTEQREERLLAALPAEPRARAWSAVVAGEGNRRLFADLGAGKVIEGGQTMNPSTADLLEAVEAVGADEAVLLPNNKNVLMAAEQAARVAGRPVHVVPTESIPAGLAALVAFHGERSAEENAAAMLEALQQVATGEVTVASRDSSVDGIVVRAGDYLACSTATPSPPARASTRWRARCSTGSSPNRATCSRSCRRGRSLAERRSRRARRSHPELELDVHAGGQPHYPLLLSAE